MIISSILSRENLKINDSIKLLWTTANNSFTSFIQSLGYELISINQIYYGNINPNIIVCNNKIEYYNQCYNLSRQLHLPVLLIDHIPKNDMFDDTKIQQLNYFPCYHHICISKKISDSWNLVNAQVLSYNNEESNKEIWKNIIYQLTKKIFKI